MQFWKPVEWDSAKDELLRERRGVSFGDVVAAVTEGDLIDITPHPNQKRYPHQRMFIVTIRSYVYNVPFVEDEKKIFFKTIIPDSDATKRYLLK